MTNHRAGKTNARDPRGGRYGKSYKHETARLLRRKARQLVQRWRER